jgi:hypothetical protein
MKRIAHPPPDVAYQRVHMHLAKLIVRRWRAAGVVRWLPDDEFAPRPAGDHLWDLLETPACETQRFRCAICKVVTTSPAGRCGGKHLDDAVWPIFEALNQGITYAPDADGVPWPQTEPMPSTSRVTVVAPLER